MNTTKRIDPPELDGKEPLATGYKIFNYDWSANGNYMYADEDGNVEGSVHTVTGRLDMCGNGLHFCKNPLDCMRYQTLIQWNKFAYVEAYDEIKEGDDKCCARTLQIVKVLSFDEMIKAIKEFQLNAENENIDSGIRYGSGINYGWGINYGSGINYGRGINSGSGINGGKFIHKCEGLSKCILCAGIKGGYMLIFNKPVTEERFNVVWNKLSSWFPNFTNAEELKKKYGNGEWESTPATQIRGRSVKEAYSEMPQEMIEYIKSMPEYDEAIFKAITEGET